MTDVAGEKDPLGSDLRKARRKRSLPPNAMCICGENRPEALEVDHPAGHANAPDLVIVRCKNCHASFSEAQRDVGADLSHRPERTRAEMAEAGMRSLAPHHEELARQHEEWADDLLDHFAMLDDHFPEWRQLPGAHA